MPAVAPFDERHALALDGARQNHRRAAARPARRVERIENRRHVVAIDDDGVPAERAPAVLELRHVVRPHRRPALTERVDVGHTAQIVETGRRGGVGRFPDRSFRRLTVAEQHVGAIRRPDAARVQRRPDRRTDALPERARRHVDERQARRRMPFEVGVDAAQLEQLAPVERAGLSPRGVENRRGVALRKDEAIGVGIVRIAGIEAHFGEEQRGHQVGHRAAAGRMAAGRLRGRADRVDAQARGDVL